MECLGYEIERCCGMSEMRFWIDELWLLGPRLIERLNDEWGWWNLNISYFLQELRWWFEMRLNERGRGGMEELIEWIVCESDEWHPWRAQKHDFSNDAFVIQYDAGGDANWIKQFGTSSDDYGYDCDSDGDGNVYVTGGTTGAIGDSNSGSWDVFVVSYSSSGASRFEIQFGSSSHDYGFGIVYHDNSLFVGGYYYQSGDKTFIAKLL